MSDALPPSKLSRVRAALAAGDSRLALRICAKFPQLGEHKARITRGWAAVQNPDFYTQLGMDPSELERDAILAIRERYGL
jgi:hypothetical protein